eukprot:scaffold100_cov154-Alexandrium_tamarense.AAC.7
MSPSKYVQESVSNCVKHVKANMSDMFSLPKKAINPFTTDYEPMEDGTPELDAEHASYYQQLIGIMRWMVEIGRIDIDAQEFYRDAKEALPPNMPPARGRTVDLRLYINSDHAGDKVTRRSHTVYNIYLNSAPIKWLSKNKSTVETSVFGAEFVPMKHGIDTVRGIPYKVTNSSKPESQLKKKCNSICYHAVRESVAMGETLVSHIPIDKKTANDLS